MNKIRERDIFKIVILVVVVSLLNFIFSINVYAGLPGKNIEYICEVCYEPIPISRIACETMSTNTFLGVQIMLMTAVEGIKDKLKRVTIDCNFPVGELYRGYKAIIDLK